MASGGGCREAPPTRWTVRKPEGQEKQASKGLRRPGALSRRLSPAAKTCARATNSRFRVAFEIHFARLISKAIGAALRSGMKQALLAAGIEALSGHLT